MWKLILFSAAMAILVVASLAFARYRRVAAEAEGAMEALAARFSHSAVARFELGLVAGLPEIAQRYFKHAIRPGTPLRAAVRLEMKGTFLLGDKDSFQSYAMTARQVLAPPSEFVWIPMMRSGPLRISGSDALVRGTAWTRFWMNGLVPVANVQSSPDIVRSALTRSAMEAVGVPASLLPASGVTWEQTGNDTARLHFPTAIKPVDLTLDAEGRVKQITTSRWSDANPDHVFRLQPFGGSVEAEIEFGGFTIPSELQVGNHYGTDSYLPFFQARVTAAQYL